MPDSFREALEKLVVGLSVVSPNYRPQRRIGFQCGPVDGDGVAFQQSFFGQHTQHPEKYFAMGLHINQAAST
jgi:hypothetical protein